MLKKFDNSLPLALASYNAGPGRVKIWLKRYGDPRTNQISYHDWIESIPISETRFYVKKVISNLRIYQQKYNLKYTCNFFKCHIDIMSFWHYICIITITLPILGR